MSEIFHLDQNPNFENKIIYDYGKTVINKNEMTLPTDKTKPFNMTFYNGTNEPNIFYAADGSTTSYNSEKCYIYKLIHNNISSLTLDEYDPSIIGELVIEHTKPGDHSNKHYVCFLLTTGSPDNVNEIDIALSFKEQNKLSQTQTELNKIIPKQDHCIIYNSKNSNNGIENTVYVFTTPIEVNARSKDFITKGFTNSTDLFNKYGSRYVVLPTTNISKRGDEEIYIDCSPTGESQETIDTYNIPINSKMDSQQIESNNMKTATNFAIFTIFSTALLFIIPHLYKISVLKSAVQTGLDVTPMVRVQSIDWVIGLVFLIATIILLISGFTNENDNIVFAGLGIFYVLFVSVCILYTKKGDAEFVKIDGVQLDYKEGKSNFEWKDFINVIFNIPKYWFNEKALPVFIVALVVYMVALVMIRMISDISSNTFWYAFGVGGFGILPLITYTTHYVVQLNKGTLGKQSAKVAPV